MLEMLTIRPQPASSMYGQTARVAKNGPRKLTPTTASHCSVVISPSGAGRANPALLISTRGGPRSDAALDTASITALSSATSAAIASAIPPAAVIASTVSVQPWASPSTTATG